jgi:hypothetical protein
MRSILFATVIAVLSALPAVAEPPGPGKPDKSANAGNPFPAKRAGAGNACAAYGPGFAKVDGTETCVKIGGSVGVAAGGSTGTR